MIVFVNNDRLELPEGKIPLVLRHMQILKPKGFALAVNNEVIPKTAWDTFILRENDKITLIKATQGG